MKLIRVHNDGRFGRYIKLLIVTDDATFCRAECDDRGFVTVFGGSVWPGDLPEVFEKRGQATAQCPTNTYLKPEILAHFSRSVATLEFRR